MINVRVLVFLLYNWYFTVSRFPPKSVKYRYVALFGAKWRNQQLTVVSAIWRQMPVLSGIWRQMALPVLGATWRYLALFGAKYRRRAGSAI